MKSILLLFTISFFFGSTAFGQVNPRVRNNTSSTLTVMVRSADDCAGTGSSTSAWFTLDPTEFMFISASGSEVIALDISGSGNYYAEDCTDCGTSATDYEVVFGGIDCDYEIAINDL